MLNLYQQADSKVTFVHSASKNKKHTCTSICKYYISRKMSENIMSVSKYHFKTGRYNINVGDNEGNMPLHTAVKEEKLDIVKSVLEYGCDVNSRNNNRETALHLAAKRQKLNIMHTLLMEGANPNLQDSQNNTPMQTFLLACTDGQWAKQEDKSRILLMLKEMLTKGARSNLKNNQGRTAVHMAIRSGQQEVVEILMQDAIKAMKVNQGRCGTVFGCGAR